MKIKMENKPEPKRGGKKKKEDSLIKGERDRQ